MISNPYKIVFCALSLLIMHMPLCVYTQEAKQKKITARSVYYDVPSGYTQLGNTDLFYRQKSESIDFIGRFSSEYYSSTYSNGGYKLAIQVENKSAESVDCLSGSTIDGVECSVSVVPQGELGKVIYTVTNTNPEDVVVSLGTHSDVMIGSNDGAPISRRIDTIGNTYGLTLRDGNGAELCILFGSGLVGVNSVSDFWFGHYNTNRDAYQMVGNYSSGSNYMQENGSYDSGMGWCWKNRTIPANSSIEFSYLIGVGDVNLEPNSSFEVTPEDPDGWNDLFRPHRLTLEGEYESPAGQKGKIQYAVEDSEEWLDLTDEIESGSTFTASLVAMFDANKGNHTIRFRTMDAVGNTSMLTPIIYKDVSHYPVTGIEERVYNWGEPIYQNKLMCDLPSDQYDITGYKDNTEVGTATFNIEGIFPHSIGRKTYRYSIVPLSLEGGVTIAPESHVYDGKEHHPEWRFTNEVFSSLEETRDYSVVWSNAVLPGKAGIRITGKGNFTGELTAEFIIDKAPLRETLYSVSFPNEDITFDNAPHGASVSVSDGVGQAMIRYSAVGEEDLSETAPFANGTYDIHIGFEDGELYYGKELEKVFTFTIYQFSEDDWAAIQDIVPALSACGWSAPWNLTGGISAASALEGLKIEQGKVVGLDLSQSSLNGPFPVELFALDNLKHLNLSGNDFDGAVESVAAFVQVHPGTGRYIEELNISDNSFAGNLGVLAACMPNLTSLDASGNRLSDIYPMISEKVVDLNISKQNLDRVMAYDVSGTSIEEMVAQIPTILVYDHKTRSYTRPLNLMCSTDEDFSMTLTYDNGRLGITAVSEQNAYHGESGEILDVVALSSDGQTEEGYMKIKLIFESGDANFDGKISILDLQSTVLYAFDDYRRYPFNFTAADTYSDGRINVQDVICTANLLVTRNVDDNPVQKIKGSDRSGDTAEACVFIETGKLYLVSDEPVAAIDIVVNGDIDWQLDEYGFDTVVEQNHLIGYSLAGVTLPEGRIQIGEVREDGLIVNCELSDVEARPITVHAADNTSGVSTIGKANEENYSIYDLHGRSLNSTVGDMYILKTRKGVQKVLKGNK